MALQETAISVMIPESQQDFRQLVLPSLRSRENSRHVNNGWGLRHETASTESNSSSSERPLFPITLSSHSRTESYDRVDLNLPVNRSAVVHKQEQYMISHVVSVKISQEIEILNEQTYYLCKTNKNIL